MFKVGEKISDFEFDVFLNDAEKKVKFSDFSGKWLVLLFYPADFTFVCPTELEEAAINYNEFTKLGAEVVSFSRDTVFVHKAWHDNSPAIKKVTFPMAADPTGEICKAFGTAGEKESLCCRATFIIDPDGVVKSIEMHDNSIGRSTKEILRKLQACIFVKNNKGLVCPASWQPGMKTL